MNRSAAFVRFGSNHVCAYRKRRQAKPFLCTNYTHNEVRRGATLTHLSQISINNSKLLTLPLPSPPPKTPLKPHGSSFVRLLRFMENPIGACCPPRIRQNMINDPIKCGHPGAASSRSKTHCVGAKVTRIHRKRRIRQLPWTERCGWGARCYGVRICRLSFFACRGSLSQLSTEPKLNIDCRPFRFSSSPRGVRGAVWKMGNYTTGSTKYWKFSLSRFRLDEILIRIIGAIFVDTFLFTELREMAR